MKKLRVTPTQWLDSLILFGAHYLGVLFLQQFISFEPGYAAWTILVSVPIFILLSRKLNLSLPITDLFSFRDFRNIVLQIAIVLLINGGISLIFKEDEAVFHLIFSGLLALVLMIAARVICKVAIDALKDAEKETVLEKENVLVIGAGSGAKILIQTLIREKKSRGVTIKGILDDNPNLKGNSLGGIPILGTASEASKWIQQLAIQRVIIAIPSLSSEGYNKILSYLPTPKVAVTTMPSVEELALGKLTTTRLRPIAITDLLGREEVLLDDVKAASRLKGKVLLVTGAGGSIGSEICRTLLQFKPKKLLLLGHGENSIYTIHQELLHHPEKKETLLVPLIADIQDAEKIQNLMEEHRPDFVYHAAAHKHVPLMESNPQEAVKNNIFGTMNVATAAKKANVEQFVMVSTDKAVNPPNVMGATKRIAEMVVTQLNEAGKTRFCAVRFGNVLGSRGSVVPLFKRQIESGGPVTVTDFRMTRYFMSIPEASRLVIQAGNLSTGGEIFILDMGKPVAITDLAEKMIELSGFKKEEIGIIETGIRPGEKLYEELLLKKERAEKQVHDKIFLGKVKSAEKNRLQTFIYELPGLTNEELKKKLIAFANQPLNEEESL